MCGIQIVKEPMGQNWPKGAGWAGPSEKRAGAGLVPVGLGVLLSGLRVLPDYGEAFRAKTGWVCSGGLWRLGLGGQGV